MKILSSAISLIILVAASYFAVDRYFPAWTAELRAYLHKSGAEWSETAKQNDPAGYLRFSQQKLEEQKLHVGKAIKEISISAAPLKTQIENIKDELPKTVALLKEGAGIYQQALDVINSGNVVNGIKFAGRTYPDMDTFKKQLEVLFQEKVSKEALLKKLEATEKKLIDGAIAARLQLTNIETELASIPAKIAIVEIDRMSEKVKEIIKTTEQATLNVTAGLQGLDDSMNLIGTTKELLKSAGNSGSSIGTNADFEKFLQSQPAQKASF